MGVQLMAIGIGISLWQPRGSSGVVELNPDPGFDQPGLWTTPAGHTVSGSRLQINTTGGGAQSTISCANFVIGGVYGYSYDILNYVSGTARLVFAGVGTSTRASNGTTTGQLTATALAPSINVQNLSSTAQFDFDNVHVWRIS
jgi:hypothetical protein